MAQDDRGLVLRGFFLLAFIGVLVTGVMAMLFMRPQSAPPPVAIGPEPLVASLVAGVPVGIPWGVVHELGETLPSAPGWEIRYNAATTLARRGSAAVPWHRLREMLDEKQQMRNAHVRLPDGTLVIDESAARSNMIGALKAVAAWHENQKDPREASPGLREIYAMVDQLTESPIAELKAQAEKARGTFFR